MEISLGLGCNNQQLSIFGFVGQIEVPQNGYLNGVLCTGVFYGGPHGQTLAKMRADSFKNRIHVDIQHDFSKLTYKIIRAKETDSLREVPVKKCFNAVLLRSKVGGTCLRIDQDFQVPKFAKLRLGGANLEFLKQCDRKIYFRHIDGSLDSQGVLEVSYTALTSEEISSEFADFWKPMWQRDLRQQQFSGDNWSEFQAILQSCELPHIPQIEIPWDDVDRWMRIIAKLPAAKAIGPCGWSNDELRCLPRVCVCDLVWIFKQVAVVGFSSNLMKAKTILLSKIPVPLSMHHARPITILSCLHRLFGKFVFRSVADVWKDHFPFPVSGGLPGRGVKELAYAQKRMIEEAIRSNDVLGGYSLDLIKAFNTFARYPSALIMHRLGIPWTLLRSWLHSLDKLVRFPIVEGQISIGITSTTGVPEGCSMSVLSMLALSCAYYFRVIREHVFPFAYADNWSWMSKQQQAHLTAHRDVLALTSALKLSIDHAKSWHWATTKQFREFCATNCLTQDGTVAAVKTCVKDLGEIVHYNKSVTLGFIKEKIAEAITRVHRIEWIPCSLQKKAHLIQSSAWPMALYSADTTYIGKKHFVDLRRACVTALVGHWHSASPVMSCNFLSRFLMDPFLHALCQCARIVRRLATTALPIAADTVKAMAAFTGQRPFGPASAFRVYLNQVGWTIADNGDITGPDHLKCNVLRDHCRKIINTFKQMWYMSLLNLSDRKGIGDFLPDPGLSIRVFSKLQDEEQQLIKLNVAGGYQTDSMKAKWDDKVSGNCDFCGLLDTREHRLLECEALTEIRQEWKATCQFISHDRPEWIYLPIPRQHPEVMILRAWTQLIKEPATPLIVTMDDRHYRFFTDGGALNPQIPCARVASWAVVQDVAQTPETRKSALDFAFGPKPVFPAFVTTSVGLVPGDQNVSRAELFAVLIALESFASYRSRRNC